MILSYVPPEEAGRGDPMAVLYCECGHKIWSELWWKEPKDVLLFFDHAESSVTYGEQVTRCPGCGQELRFGLRRPGSPATA